MTLATACTMAKFVTALFRDRLSANAAVEQLVQARFSRDDIGVMVTETTLGRELAMLPGGVPCSSGVFGALVASLVAVGSLAVPSLGVRAAGPLAPALVSAAAAAGSLLGALVGAGLPESEAKLAADRLRGGAILLAVRVGEADHARLAYELLKLAGGDSPPVRAALAAS
jgi:hypothetical protein